MRTGARPGIRSAACAIPVRVGSPAGSSCSADPSSPCASSRKLNRPTRGPATCAGVGGRCWGVATPPAGPELRQTAAGGAVSRTVGDAADDVVAPPPAIARKPDRRRRGGGRKQSDRTGPQRRRDALRSAVPATTQCAMQSQRVEGAFAARASSGEGVLWAGGTPERSWLTRCMRASPGTLSAGAA